MLTAVSRFQAGGSLIVLNKNKERCAPHIRPVAMGMCAVLGLISCVYSMHVGTVFHNHIMHACVCYHTH